MTRERWQQIERVLDGALALAADERDEFLDRACAGNKELQREIAALLAASERCRVFLERPAIVHLAALLAHRKLS